MNWLMPPETDAQERIWMAFPPQGASVFEDAESAHEARTAWAAVAHAIIDFEPVSMIVDPADRAVAPKYLSREIDVVEAPLDDAWMRDIGPTFVRGTDGRVAAVDWVFNGWGARDWARWDNDAHIGRFVGQLAGVEIVSSSLVNEGGGIQVDGEGTVLVTETVQLDPSRNPGLDKRAVEAELARTIGARHVICCRAASLETRRGSARVDTWTSSSPFLRPDGCWCTCRTTPHIPTTRSPRKSSTCWHRAATPRERHGR